MTDCKPKNLFLIFFIVISFLHSSAQNKEADSLKRLLSVTTADTMRVYYMYKISDAYKNTDLTVAWEYADNALKLAQKIKYKRGEARSHTRLGNIFTATGQFDTSLAEHLISLKLCDSMHDDMGVAAAHNNIALMYTSRNLTDDYKYAIENYKEAKLSYEKLNDSAKLTTVLLNIGDGFEKMEVLDSAAIYSNMAKKIAQKREDFESLGVIYTNLGSVSYKSGKIEEALRDLRVGIYYMTAIKDHHSMSMAWSTLASCFKKLNKIDSFEFYAKKAIEMGDSTTNHAAVLDAAVQLSKYYASDSNYAAYYKYKEIAETKDSIINDNKRTARIEQLKKQEELRLAEKKAKEDAAAEARKHAVQKVLLVGFIITLFVALIILKQLKAKPEAIRNLSFICLLVVFEFITFIIHPYIDKLTDHKPIYMVLILAVVAGLLHQLRDKFELWLEKILINSKKRQHSQKDGQQHHQKTATDVHVRSDKKKLPIKKDEKHSGHSRHDGKK